MELRHLRTFLAVVDHGGFRRAAAKLHFSQPAITQQVHELERSLGVALFERSPGHARLTGAGRRFAEDARRLIEESDDAVAAARRPDVAETLRIGAFPGAAAELTQPMFVELRRRLPSATLELVPLELRRWGAAVDGVDALIVRDPIDQDLVRATELFSEPLLAAVPWSWPQREASVLTLAEFLALPLIRLSPRIPAELRDHWCLMGLRGGREPEFRGHGAESAADVADDVASGFGAALASASLRRSFAQSRICFMPLAPAQLTRCWLTTRRHDDRPVIDTLHRETEAISRRLRPLVLP